MENNHTKSNLYHSSPHWVVEDAVYVRDYKVKVWFRDGSIKIVDLYDRLFHSPLQGEVFEPLKNLEYFATVRYSEDLGTITWSNGADIAPETLYELGVEGKSSESNIPSKFTN